MVIIPNYVSGHLFVGLFFFIIIYGIGIVWIISERTTSYHCSDDYSSVSSRHRATTTKDMWIAVLWPLTALIVVPLRILGLINILMHYVLLLLGINYKDTYLSKKINKLCN